MPLTRQAELLGISRGSLYYLPRAVPAADLAIMRRIDELHLDYPFAGSRMLRDLCAAKASGRAGSSCLDDAADGDRSALPTAAYLQTGRWAQDLSISAARPDGERANQVWAMDITYIPMARGFVYLAAVVDWFSRRVLAWQVSITLEVDFCFDALEEALARHGRPEIFNTDQGSQFTSPAFTGLLLKNASRSAWTAAVPGATTSSSSGCGARSNTRRCTCGPMTASVRHALDRSVSGFLQPQASAFEP